MKPLKLCRALCVGAVSLFLCAGPASAEDYTDIWWNVGGTEDGWGVNLIQSQDFIFATFFVYGPAPAKTPIWYAGNLTRQASGSFSGGLFQTTGTGIGAPWAPGDHTVVQVGTATFTPTSSTTGTLVYNVGAVGVSKSIARQNLTSIALGGSYIGSAVVNTSGCTSSGQQIFDVDPVVSQNTGGQLQIVLTFGSESCTLQGLYAQEGTLFRIPTASYVCTQGTMTTLDTTATVYEVKATSIGLEGRWQAPNVGGCQEDGTFSSIFP